MILTHYTLNTGHTSTSDRSEIQPQVLQTLAPIVQNGGPIPGVAPFRVETVREPELALFTIFRGRDPITLSLLVWSKEAEHAAWTIIKKTYMSLRDDPILTAQKPERLPWLAVVILPAIVLQTKEDIRWLGDFERCFAFAILDTVT